MKKIPGHPGYLITEDGRVFSHVKGGRVELKQYLSDRGYMRVHPYVQGKRTNGRVHRLIALAYHGPALGREACHVDGNKLNNTVSNIYWATHADNIRDAVRHGVGYFKAGAAHPQSKLTEEQARSILASPLPGSVLARRMGVSRFCVYDIRLGRSWKHLRGSNVRP